MSARKLRLLALLPGLLLAPRALQAGAAPAATPQPSAAAAATATAKPSPSASPRPMISLEHPDRVLMRHTHQVLEGLVTRIDRRHVVLETPYGVVLVPRQDAEEIDFGLASRLRRLAEDDYRGRYQVAVWAANAGLVEEAIELLGQVLGREGVPDDAWKLRGTLLAGRFRFREAVQDYREYLRRHPEETALREYVAELEQLATTAGAPAASSRPRPIGPRATLVAVATGVAAATPQPTGGAREGLETRTWRYERWAKEANCTVGTLEGNNQYLAVELTGQGTGDKVAIGTAVHLDLSDKKEFVFKVYNDSNQVLHVALAVFAGPNSTFFESRAVRVPQKTWHTARIPVADATWKSEATNWANNAALANPENVRRVLLMLNTASQLNVYFDDMHFE